MRILLTGDLHFNKQHFQWLSEQQDNYDCLCLTGDFVDGHLDDFDSQTQWISEWLEGLRITTFVCSGNHDLDESAECRWLDGLRNPLIARDTHIRTLQGIVFGCIPYIGADFADFYDCHILLSHVPPSNTACAQTMESGVVRDWGDRDLSAALEATVIAPHYLFCGHIESPIASRDRLNGVEVINPGARHHGTTPRHEVITIDR